MASSGMNKSTWEAININCKFVQKKMQKDIEDMKNGKQPEYEVGDIVYYTPTATGTEEVGVVTHITKTECGYTYHCGAAIHNEDNISIVEGTKI